MVKKGSGDVGNCVKKMGVFFAKKRKNKEKKGADPFLYKRFTVLTRLYAGCLQLHTIEKFDH